MLVECINEFSEWGRVIGTCLITKAARVPQIGQIYEVVGEVTHDKLYYRLAEFEHTQVWGAINFKPIEEISIADLMVVEEPEYV